VSNWNLNPFDKYSEIYLLISDFSPGFIRLEFEEFILTGSSCYIVYSFRLVMAN